MTPPRGDGSPAGGRPGEVRLPASIVTAGAIALYLTLPSTVLGTARYVAGALMAALLLPLIAANPVRMTRDNRLLRRASLGFAALVLLANTVALVTLVDKLVNGHAHTGTSLLLAALQVWLVNIVAFALLYWELDRGGPVQRATAKRAVLPTADWRFSQDEDADNSDEVARASAKTSDWRPRFIDYLYVSVTNSTAFSPTDTMPLSPRAKVLMSIEAIEALLLSILVIARGVSLLH